MLSRIGWLVALTAPIIAQGVSVADIQGTAWLSPYSGQTVQNVTGVVTAKGPSGVWIAGEPSSDARKSHGVYVFGSSLVNRTAVGDLISLSARVADYRASGTARANDLVLTELTSPTNLTVLSSGNPVEPRVLSGSLVPPTQALSGLDNVAGPDGWLALPNNQSLVTRTNATLQPTQYGLDFWASLEGQLVTLPSPVALNFENQYGEFWAASAGWSLTGKNARGGLTMTFGPDGVPDANPEAILVDNPLDGTKNPTTSLGMTFGDITGIVQYQFGFWYLMPLTAPTVAFKPPYNPPASDLSADVSNPCSLLFGDYNVENMSPSSAHIPAVANHIGNFLKTPTVVLVQEIQDNSGPTDDGVVSANETLAALSRAIKSATGVEYAWLDLPPVNNQDGGAPGGNIRVAYLYRAEKVSLVPGSPIGGALDANQVLTDAAGDVYLKYNPGRIEPTNAAWNASRKPLVAHWQTTTGERFFTVNVHFASKGGSASSQGDARPPVNGVVEGRREQVAITGAWLKTLLAKDADASILVGGDMNEYIMTRVVFKGFEGVVYDLDEVAGIPPVERYTYVFDQNTQELDHLFVSSAIKARGAQLEHVHVNTWSPSYDERISDHDPSVAKLLICTNLQKFTGALGGVAPPPVTLRRGKYYANGKSYYLRATARTASCNDQGAACTAYAKTHNDVSIAACVAQTAKCLLQVLF